MGMYAVGVKTSTPATATSLATEYYNMIYRPVNGRDRTRAAGLVTVTTLTNGMTDVRVVDEQGEPMLLDSKRSKYMRSAIVNYERDHR
jgi:hypothetical protein